MTLHEGGCRTVDLQTHPFFSQKGCMVIQGGSTQVTHDFSKNDTTELISELGFAVLSYGFSEFCICKDETRTGFFGLR